MKNNNDYSDEFLNAYIDGELDAEETGRLLDELRYNEVLSARITDLQKVREMVRYAYHEKVPPTQGLRAKSSVLKKSRMAFAASIILSLGMALGWGLHLHSQSSTGLLDIAEAMRCTLEYFQGIIPADWMYLQLYEPDLGSMRTLAMRRETRTMERWLETRTST